MDTDDFKYNGGCEMEIYQLNALNFSYPESERTILNNVDLTVREGDFVVLCGKSGSGKTTLLAHLKPFLTPHGKKSGDIYFLGKPITELDDRAQAADIGFVSQNPDNQIVTDKVWHELAFGLESLGYDNQTIRMRVAEMASFFGIQTWFMKDVAELSGGQKQLLNLASVMVMQPKVLILDEPTAQLDPIAAKEFLETVKKINLELGVTVMIVEHRLEEAFPLADQVIIMEEGQVRFCGTPEAIGAALKQTGNAMLRYVPTAMRIYAGVAGADEKPCPITVRDGRRFLNQLKLKKETFALKPTPTVAKPYGIKLHQIYFKYEKNAPDTISGLSLEVPEGEIYGLLGGNGTGKTTTISVMAGLKTPYRGKVSHGGKKIRVLPQNPQSLFVMNTVEKELFHTTKDKEKARELARFTEIAHLMAQHPYDLSGGEQQRLALCKVLLTEPDILLLDEPTKGLDNEFKDKLGALLLELKHKGMTILMVSHDVEFCALFADQCGLMFNGEIIATGTPGVFFAGASFYTTAANRIARHLWPQLITAREVIEKCNQN